VRKKATSGSGDPVVPFTASRDADRTIEALTATCAALLQVVQSLKGENFVPVVPSLSLHQQGPPRAARPLTLRELIDAFLESKAKVKRSPRYLRQLKTILKRFQKGRSAKPAGLVTLSDVEKWLDSQPWGARTRLGASRDVRTLYAWGIKRGLVDLNPAAGVELEACDRKGKIHIHTPQEVRKVLETARQVDPQVCRLLAVRYFAGVRSSEASRLREEDIRDGWIEVPANKSKTRSRRLVQIQPALKAYMDLTPPLVALRTDRVRQTVKAAGVVWNSNVTRHSFVSYHLAAFRSSSETALQAGHSEEILFRHYREMVSQEQAREFWAIRPG